MKVVKHKTTGRLIHRTIPNFQDGEGIKSALTYYAFDKDELEETTATLEEWEAELALRREENLPRSMHIAALKSVAMVNGSPRGTVIRKHLGQNYEVVNCRVSQSAYTNYQAGEIKVFNPAYLITAPENADCFILMSFISETPYDTEIEIPVIMDKVVK